MSDQFLRNEFYSNENNSGLIFNKNIINSDLASDKDTGADNLIGVSWYKIAYHMLTSRHIDKVEEEQLAPNKQIFNQFSARGHELSQVILGLYLNHKHDGVSGYYRSRPLLLALGLSLEDAFAGPLTKEGGLSDGRDIGVVYNMKKTNCPTVLPMHGGVGGQYTPVTGWAQAILYKKEVLGLKEYENAIAVSHGGEASVVTNGFWAALTNATTLNLPQLFFIEDNGFGISVPSEVQVPGGDITENIKSFKNLKIFNGDGTDPVEVNRIINRVINNLRRHGSGPALIRFKVPRLNGHTFQDDQSYKTSKMIENELLNDPLVKLKDFMIGNLLSELEWKELEIKAKKNVEDALERAKLRNFPDINNVKSYVFDEQEAAGNSENNKEVDIAKENNAKKLRLNMVSSIRKTLDTELTVNKNMLVFGQDVGVKGGVHTATLGLQKKHGASRVFDTNLSEEGIIGRAVGMAYAGLRVVPEIQFRKYADSAAEQLNDCGMVRWRTNNKFSAPIVVRIPVGYSKRGDPWHAECKEVAWAHCIGWQVAFPSNAQDASGLLRTALRSNNPTIFLEHRSQLDSLWAKREWKGDDYTLPFGKAKTVSNGNRLSVISWGAMLELCSEVVDRYGKDVELIDLRTIVPCDKDAIFTSVKKTGKALIVHEDNLTAGFGAEISALIMENCFDYLDAPIQRLATPDVPCPHNIDLMNAVLPNKEKICHAIESLLEY